MKLVFCLGLCLLFTALWFPGSSLATDKLTVEVRAITGWTLIYLDEPASFGYGGAVKYYFKPRLALDAELLYTTTSRFEDYLLTPCIVFHFNNPAVKPVSPYVFGGLGLRHELDKAIDYTSDKAIIRGGFGLRFAFSQRWFAIAEGRIVGFVVGVGFAH